MLSTIRGKSGVVILTPVQALSWKDSCVQIKKKVVDGSCVGEEKIGVEVERRSRWRNCGVEEAESCSLSEILSRLRIVGAVPIVAWRLGEFTQCGFLVTLPASSSSREVNAVACGPPALPQHNIRRKGKPTPRTLVQRAWRRLG